MTQHAITPALPSIYVDADACPVKDEAMRVAERHGLTVVFVSNAAMRLPRENWIRLVVVSGAFDAADDWIADNAAPNDIAVTSDMPLAARLVAKGVHTLSHAGRVFSPANIGMALGMRNLNQELRESHVIKGHNAAFSPRDRSNFLQALDNAVVKAKRSAG
ncbi:MAG: YaiI/YqxD family protein [Phyllobacteriaceae bacterium]|nr:YaiI/YqxD family protein [Phyllobacteriaceae bacterium]